MDNKKTVKNLAISFILIMILFYLLFSFSLYNLDPYYWGQDIRILYVILSIPISLILSIVMYATLD
jgi:hypothetical protein